MTINFTYRGLNFQSWLLIGILIYTCVVVFLVCVRSCVINKTCCSLSESGLHACYVNNFRCCKDCGRENCSRIALCCHKKHKVNGCKCKCFWPRCNYFYCCCCELSLPQNVKTVSTVEEFVKTFK